MGNNKKNKAKKANNSQAQKAIDAPQKKGSSKSTKGKPVNDMAIAQLTPYFLIVFAIFMLLCLVTGDMFDSKDALGIVGRGMRNFMCGLFGITAYAIPFLLAYLGIRWKRFTLSGTLTSKVAITLLTIVDLGALIHVFTVKANGTTYGMFKLGALFAAGKELRGGGMIGGFFGEGAYKLFNVMGSAVICIALLVVFGIFLVGLSPAEAWSKLCTHIKFVKARAEARRENALLAAEEEEAKKEEKKKQDVEELNRLIKEDAEKMRERAVSKKAKESAKDIKEQEPEKEEEHELSAEEELDLMFKEDEERRKREARIAEKRRAAQLQKETVKKDDARIIEKLKNVEPDLNSNEKPTDENNEETAEAKENAKGFFNKKDSPQKLKEKNDEVDEDDDENVLDKLFVDPVDKEDAPPSEKLEVRKLALKKIENDECVADGLRLDESETTEETREERQERMSKLDARGNDLIEYTFPPYNLLKMESEAAEADAEAELRANADILMQTFDDFKVGIKEISYSRGPTITRYELLPSSGTRIRTIANLVDDIALALATSGIRMEAPIPNKSLVGIEVPNKVRSNVYARQLIESDTFNKAESRLWTCLGKDVAGSPVFFDISKMPHLLIAGATGMGKSVCINTIIVSLLYKARPDEVKLMLIDPKKVEFGVYNGIPHLLVPVVTDPKKSAGTLQWAVNEMERRFELIESVNTRDIKSYNAITAGDPEKEFMPHIVIIIDELADLMMTAADDVETSICRLAQKARAAGIHLIIGTQRPSVDVITGLIKSNIPSRIAFTVASQIDSRTILDTAGAEKLIGKGDMLFNPVGAMKPIRVQGAFISEDEVINITNFIKANSSAVKYDDGVISSIEEAAAMCGQKKGSKEAAAAADALIGDADPLFRRALEIAVDNGSMATSMLQRNINVGYGRAARIIDRMEKLRFVSPPRGNKHREVLITREQFDQMVMDNDPRVDGLSE